MDTELLAIASILIVAARIALRVRELVDQTAEGDNPENS